MTTEANKRWQHRQREICAAANWLRNFELSRIESRYELESDEGGTAREKAIRIQQAQR